VQPRQAYVSHDRYIKITADRLAECFGIAKANAILLATTQRWVRSVILPLSRQYRADKYYGVRTMNGKFVTDTWWSKIRSLSGNIASQVYYHKSGFSAPYHLHTATGNTLGYSLLSLIHDYGKPEHLTFDGIPTQTGHNTLFMQTICQAKISFHISVPYQPNENPAEDGVQEVKRRIYCIMHKHNILRRLWDFVLAWVFETGNVTVSSSRYANGRTPLEHLTGETPDITEYLDFSPYEWVTYKQNACLGRPHIVWWLGVSHRIGPLMSYWVLLESGIPISCTTAQPMSEMDR